VFRESPLCPHHAHVLLTTAAVVLVMRYRPSTEKRQTDGGRHLIGRHRGQPTGHV
jgi:hypothetical protein